MRIRIFHFLLALTLGITLLPSSTMASSGHGNGGQRIDRDSDRQHDRDDDHPGVRGHHDRDDRDHDRDHDRDDRGRPPGWRHGKKTGWGNCGLPPGQAKKHGCQGKRSVVHHRDGDHDRDDHGRDRDHDRDHDKRNR